MDHLWSPWRYRYVTRTGRPEGCVFCLKPERDSDRENFVLFRGSHCFVILNLYPYTSGHVMVVPYDHASRLDEISEEAAAEMMALTRRTAGVLERVYRPKGLNIGMNLGECAGAGIAGHLHMHILPRWPGDVNFMTTIGETRVLPEDLETTYERLLREF